MSDTGRHIPEETKRQVRQDCGFGCVICGMPVFHYDHIEEFAQVRQHTRENLALLCPNHHQDKTSGRLSAEKVLAARQAPFNGGRSRTSNYKLVSGVTAEAWLGSNVAYDPGEAPDFHVLWINGEGFLTIHHEADGFSYSAKVTDEQGTVLLHIQRGELTVSTGIWDYRYEGKTLEVRAGPGQIIFASELSDHAIRVTRGYFVDAFETGVVIRAGGELVFTISGLEVGEMHECKVGIHPGGGWAVARFSCFEEAQVPRGFGYLRGWPAEYEAMAETLRIDAMNGVPGPRPAGLAAFRPFPRS